MSSSLSSASADTPSIITDSIDIYDIITKSEDFSVDGITIEHYEFGPKIPKSIWEIIGTKVSNKEKEMKICVEPDKFITLRFDGNNFSKVIPKLKIAGFLEHGYSKTFATIMQGATQKVMKKFNAIYGFTQSDEITIIIPSTNKDGTHIFDGRRDKLISLGASCISTYFVSELSKINSIPDDIDILFDGRMAYWNTLRDAFELILWRAYDCSINGISTAVINYGADTTIKKSNTAIKLMWLMTQGRLPLDTHEVHGSFFAKTQIKKICVNPITGESVEVMRSVILNVNGNVLFNMKRNVFGI
jgi:tRNA(His) 5'-end guanylyltransferase